VVDKHYRCCAKPSDHVRRAKVEVMEAVFLRLPGHTFQPIMKKVKASCPRRHRGVPARRHGTEVRTGMCSSAPSSRRSHGIAEEVCAGSQCYERGQEHGELASRPQDQGVPEQYMPRLKTSRRSTSA